jgi:glycosyltransferase involved in cell wall biosynthesis
LVRRGLVISYYFPPYGGGGVQRWVKFIKYLSRWDWRFTVISAEREKTAVVDDSLLQELPSTLKIVRVQGPGSHRFLPNAFVAQLGKGFWQRWLSACINVVDGRIKWNQLARPYINAEISKQRYDALIFTMPPYSLCNLAAELSASQNIPVYLDLRDPWTINPYKIHPTPLHLYLDRKYERGAITGIHNFISAYKSTVNYFQKEINNFRLKKVVVIPNGFDEEDLAGIQPADLSMESKFNLAFSGTFYSHLNNPENLFSAIQLLKNEGYEIHFHHIGSSAYDINKLAHRYKIHNHVHNWGYHEHKKCVEILAAMDAFCVILDERIKNADKTVGGKLYEYLGLRKPILAMVPQQGEAAQLIRETNSGIICSSYKVDQISLALRKILEKNTSFTFVGIEKYTREKQAWQLKAFLESALKS